MQMNYFLKKFFLLGPYFGMAGWLFYALLRQWQMCLVNPNAMYIFVAVISCVLVILAYYLTSSDERVKYINNGRDGTPTFFDDNIFVPIVFFVGYSFFAYYALATADRYLDFSPGAPQMMQVVKLHRSHGQKSGTAYEVKLRSLDGKGKSIVFNARREIYYSLAVGGRVEITLHPGALGFAYVDNLKPQYVSNPY